MEGAKKSTSEPTYFRILKRLGTDGQGRQIHRLLKLRWNADALETLKGVSSQFVGSEILALLGQGIEGRELGHTFRDPVLQTVEKEASHIEKTLRQH